MVVAIELKEYDHVQKDCAQTAQDPRRHIDQIGNLARVDKDRQGIRHVSQDAKDKEGQGQPFAALIFEVEPDLG